MVNDLVAFGNKLSISLIQQPLDSSIIKHKPLTNDIEEKINTLPTCLYKILGEVKDTFKFEIEVVLVKDGLIDISCSAGKILNLSNRNDAVLLNFPVGPNGHQCAVASIEMLEVIKCSHIYWPFYFPKHIADLHTLRALLPSTSPAVNLGIRADKTKPLTPPTRSPELEGLLITRTLETEAFRGTPGAHINLNVSNEDFLGRNDDLLVTRHIPHDDVHHLVKYGDTPTYDQLKTDKSKVMLSRNLFEKAPYQTQLHCVKEEPMVIALDHFLVPGYPNDTNHAYISSLSYLCTYIAKGVFKEFIINNYPRLDRCDKDLNPIKTEIISTHPSTSTSAEQDISTRDLKDTAFDLCDLNIVKQLISLTKATTLRSIGQRVSRLKKKEQQDHPEETAAPEASHRRRRGRNYGGPYSFNKSTESFWTIESTLPMQIQIHSKNTVLEQVDDMAQPRPPDDSFAKIGLSSIASCSTEDWSGEDIWSLAGVKANTLLTEVAHLGINGLNQDLFMLYLLTLVQPELSGSGEDPFEDEVNEAKCRGLIPLTPEHHLWYDLWKLHLQK